MSDKFFNVHTIERPAGLGYGYFAMTQFNDYGYPDFSERRKAAFDLAETLTAKGQPVVVKEVLHGTRSNSLIWQSLNSAEEKGLLQQ